MTTTYTLTDAAMASPLPPLSISELATGLVNLLQEAADLPAPRHIAVSNTQRITVQFGERKSSLKAVTRWALRFGGVIRSEPYDGEHGPETYCHTEFDYVGVTVEVYTFIPAKKAST
ncbi:MAG: hypothetical protein ABSA53_10755 [Streptosporangiaceae bacterium]|jgi:hypothetical protein